MWSALSVAAVLFAGIINPVIAIFLAAAFLFLFSIGRRMERARERRILSAEGFRTPHERLLPRGSEEFTHWATEPQRMLSKYGEVREEPVELFEHEDTLRHILAIARGLGTVSRHEVAERLNIRDSIAAQYLRELEKRGDLLFAGKIENTDRYQPPLRLQLG